MVPPRMTSARCRTPRSCPVPVRPTNRRGTRCSIGRGVPEDRARFARTHGSWNEAGITVEDLLVSLADKVWKAKRVTDLEALVIEWLSAASGTAAWQSFVDLDDILTPLAAGAEQRLAFQFAYPIGSGG